MEKIVIAGDFVPMLRIIESMNSGTCSKLFSTVSPIIANADYSIVNFEAPIVNQSACPIPKTGPSLKVPSESICLAKDIGFKCVTLANNHFYDYGQIGVQSTIEACIKADVDFCGGGLDIDQASSTLYKKIGDKIFAFINCCEHEYSIASNTQGGSNPMDSISQYYEIQKASKTADYVVVITHGGIEHFQYPTTRMVKLYRYFIDAGADVVINHHQHCCSGYELYNGKPIFYGIGNFCFDYEEYRNSPWNLGYLVELLFDNGEVNYRIHPFSQCNEAPDVCLLVGEHLHNWHEEINEINSVIQDSDKLESVIEDYYNSTESQYEILFTPYRGKILRRLFNKGFLPSCFNQEQWLRMRSLIFCESHNERLRHFIEGKRKEIKRK